MTFQLHEKYSSGINFPKITYHVFVCDSENYMETLFGNSFFENGISVTQKNVFGTNFAIISGWSVVSHYSAIGDTISCDAPYSAIGFRGKLFLRYPPC